MNAATVLQWTLGSIAVAALLVVGYLLDKLTQRRPKSVDEHAREAIDGVQEFCCPAHPDCEHVRRLRAALRAEAVRERGVPAGMWRSFVRAHHIDGEIDA